MSSFADHGNLNHVIVGVVENYLPHVWAWKSSGVSELAFREACDLAKGAIPTQVRNEVYEDLNNFCEQLTKLGVKVTRPPTSAFEALEETDFYFAWGNDFYNMRDLHIVFGNKILVSSPACPPRIFEIFRLRSFIESVAQDEGMKIVEAPTPNLKKNPQQEYIYDGNQLVPAENRLGTLLGGDYPEIWHRLTEEEVLFDAANIARFNEKALYLISSTGNRRAHDWLSREFKGEREFSATDVYRSSHIDSTIIPLSEDKVLVNGARVNGDNLPQGISSKEILYFEEVVPIPEAERNFHIQRKEIAKRITKLGIYCNLEEMSSPWAGLNVLVVKPSLVAVESNQVPLMRFLEEKGFDVLPVQYRHPYTFLGGLHCTTLDVSRL